MATKTKNKKKNNSKPVNKKKAPIKKERGVVLTIALIFIALHGIFGAYLYYSMAADPAVKRDWILGLMVLHFLANIVAAAGIYFWKKWGLHLFGFSTFIAVGAGLVSIGIWSLFYMVLPFVILGWLVRTKMNYFE